MRKRRRKRKMNFKTEDLLPLVGELAAKYTSKESTSITYEKARQLMEAVLYCIHEYEDQDPEGRELITRGDFPDAKNAYNMGYEMVVQKTKDTKIQYNEMMEEFHSYGNRCYYETFVKGIQGFFLYYDFRFQPQNHILTLDYPVLFPMGNLCGINAIQIYVNCIYLEQLFLRKLPEKYIRHVLTAYSVDCDELIINVAAITVRNILGGWIAGKEINTRGYTKKEQERVKEFVRGNSREVIEVVLKEGIFKLMDFLLDGNKELGNYLVSDMHDFSFELKNAVDNDCLESVLAIT
jgi:hypothetical protein